MLFGARYSGCGLHTQRDQTGCTATPHTGCTARRRHLAPCSAPAGPVTKPRSHAHADFGDADGHGTHVSGIALGACYLSPANASVPLETRSTNSSPPSPRPPSPRPPSPRPSPPPLKLKTKKAKKPPPPIPRPATPGTDGTGNGGGNVTNRSAAAGELLTNPANYVIDDAVGIAPGARLAFFDIMNKKKEYLLPSYDDLLTHQLESGVLVQSDSWGNKQ